MDIEKLEKLMKIIKNSQHLVFFGGAGVSTASNIPDFRGEHGLYNYTPEDIISHSFFEEHTKEFYEFYFDKMVYLDALPNECHKFLALLEENKMLDAVITQNIDGLHQKAGSKNVIELHGSVLRKRHCSIAAPERHIKTTPIATETNIPVTPAISFISTASLIIGNAGQIIHKKMPMHLSTSECFLAERNSTISSKLTFLR